MSERFEVGEMAILIETMNWPEYNGQECEVIEPLRGRTAWADRAHTVCKSLVGYRVRCADGKMFAVEPPNLRKRRPPQDWVRLCALDTVEEAV